MVTIKVSSLSSGLSSLHLPVPKNLYTPPFTNASRLTFYASLFKSIEINSFKAILVIQDIPKSATPLKNHESDFMYIRFHGPKGNYRDSYSNDFLNEYANYISEWIEEGKGVYVYFNNTMGNAFNNLKTFNGFFYD